MLSRVFYVPLIRLLRGNFQKLRELATLEQDHLLTSGGHFMTEASVKEQNDHTFKM